MPSMGYQAIEGKLSPSPRAELTDVVEQKLKTLFFVTLLHLELCIAASIGILNSFPPRYFHVKN